MKNLFESIAIFLVGLLSLAIVFLIVQYNMIEDENIIDDIVLPSPKKKITEKEKTDAYLSSLEGYGDDTDVKVDAQKKDTTNMVIVKSEIKKDTLDSVVEDTSKSSYTQNLEKYAEKSKNEKLDETKPVSDSVGEPEKLPEEEVVDEIGEAINAALDDL